MGQYGFGFYLLYWFFGVHPLLFLVFYRDFQVPPWILTLPEQGRKDKNPGER